MNVMDALLKRWTEEATELRERYALESAARVCEAHVKDLVKALAAAQDEELTVPEAAEETGYSAQHLRSLVAEGSIPNAGRKGKPRIRRGDLPAKKVKTAALRKASKAATKPTGRKGFNARRLVRRG